MGIALSGYVYLITGIANKFRVPKFQGYHLIYRALVHGLIFFVVSFVVYRLLFPFFSGSSELIDMVNSVFPDITQAKFNLYSILINSILIAYVVARSSNLFSYLSHNISYNFDRYRRIHAVRGSPESKIPEKFIKFPLRYTGKLKRLDIYNQATNDTFMRHILECFTNARILMVTLESRKCYVGYPYEIKTPSDGDKAQELTLLPVSTGYRHEEDLCLELTTNYEDVMRILAMTRADIDSASEEELESFKDVMDSYRITIPFSTMVTMTTFDLSKYTDFKQSEKKQQDDISSRRNSSNKPSEVVINGNDSVTPINM